MISAVLFSAHASCYFVGVFYFSFLLRLLHPSCVLAASILRLSAFEVAAMLQPRCVVVAMSLTDCGRLKRINSSGMLRS
jgi:hypothetical protein